LSVLNEVFLFSNYFQYQWIWADTGTNIYGATASTYAPVTGDIGHTLAVRVTAINDYGVDSVISASTSVIVPIGKVSYSIVCNSILYSEIGTHLTSNVARKLSQATGQYIEVGSGLTPNVVVLSGGQDGALDLSDSTQTGFNFFLKTL